MDEILDLDRLGAKPRLFISPLDWGLGHATRCIPIIKALLALNCEVIIGSDKSTFILLKKEFPTLQFIKIPGYEIEYSRKIEGFYLKMLMQLPRIITVIRHENRVLQQIIKEYKIDAVISDNRFGLHSTKVPCIYITHQIQISTGNVLGDKIASRIHKYFIKKYSVTWIPDNIINGLAGKLSHPKCLPANSLYLGALSRFEPINNLRVIYDLLISISGPEPQRTIFEQVILDQCAEISGKILLVRGLPGLITEIENKQSNLRIVNHLSALELNKAILQSKIVIARSGYTTIMDLAKLDKKAILIPTPGQAEQEYLAQFLLEKKYFYAVDQKKFVMKDALEKVRNFDFASMPLQEEKYEEIIADFVYSIKKH